MPTPTPPIFWSSEWDPRHGATITATDEAAANGFAASNLGRNGTKDRWRTNNVTGTKTVKWHLGIPKVVSGFTLRSHNGTASGTARLRYALGAEGNLTASPLYDSNALFPSGLPLHQVASMAKFPWRSFFHRFPEITADWAQLDISDATNPDGVFIGCRACHGKVFAPEFFSGVDSSYLKASDHSLSEESPHGFRSIVSQEPRMDFKRRWFSYTRDEADTLSEMYLLDGISNDIVAVANPASDKLVDLGLGTYRFKNDVDVQFVARTGETQGVWRYTFDLEAAI